MMQDLNKLVVETYDEIAEKYYQEFGNNMTDKKIIDKFCDCVRNGKILDAGCGVGNLTKYINDKGFEVVGIDLSRKMLEVANREFPNIQFLKMDMTKMTFQNQYFDGLFVAYSLFHIDKNKVLTTILGFKRVLKDNGKILIILQEGNGDRIIDEPLSDDKKMYVNYFQLNEICELLMDNDFKILYTEKSSINNPMELGNSKLYIIAGVSC